MSDTVETPVTNPPDAVDPTPANSEGSPPTAGAQPPPLDPKAQTIASLTAELQASRTRVDELARAYQAAERDRESFKQRLQREREQLLEVEKGKVALALLEAVDELDLCLASADATPLAQGVRLIREGLLKKALAGGIERVDLEGTPYDPNLAEATDLSLVADAAQDGLVVRVERACYRLQGRVIRPGRVTVGKHVKPAEA